MKAWSQLLPEDAEPDPGLTSRSSGAFQGEAAGKAGREIVVKLSILIVDDDVNCLDCLQGLLVAEGHEIITATRGFEALEWARRLKVLSKPLHLSILDFNIPDLLGIETFKRLVAELPMLQALFVSGDSSECLEEEVRLAGGRGLMRKPLDAARVRSAVREFGLDFRAGTERVTVT